MPRPGQRDRAPSSQRAAPIRFEDPVRSDRVGEGTVPGGDGCIACGDDGEVRCGCGSLMARLVAGRVELKCRRCKRTWSIEVRP